MWPLDNLKRSDVSNLVLENWTVASVPASLAFEPPPYLQELRLRDGTVRVLTPSHHLLWEKVLKGKAERRSNIMRAKEGASKEERERRH